MAPLLQKTLAVVAMNRFFVVVGRCCRMVQNVRAQTRASIPKHHRLLQNPFCLLVGVVAWRSKVLERTAILGSAGHMAASASRALALHPQGEYEQVVNDGAPIVRLYSQKELTFSTKDALQRGLQDIMKPVIDMANTADFIREVALYQKVFLATEAFNNYNGPGGSSALGARKDFVAQYADTDLKPVACSNIHASAPFWQKLAARWTTERRSHLVRAGRRLAGSG